MDVFLHSDPTIREWLEAAYRGDRARVVEDLDRGMDADAVGREGVKESIENNGFKIEKWRDSLNPKGLHYFNLLWVEPSGT